MTQRLRRTLAFLFLLLIPSLLCAQIPNAGFESWTAGSLDGWFINNTPLYTTCTQVTPGHSGNYALKGEAVSLFTTVMGPTIQSGVNARGFAYNQRPVTFTGWYKFTPAAGSGDRFGVNVGLFKGGTEGIGVANAAIASSATVSNWTQFTATFIYQTSDIPDTAVVQFQIVGPGTGQQAIPHVGSTYQIDDIAFAGTNAVKSRSEASPAEYALHQNFPNPFNPSTTIRYSLQHRSEVTLSVFNTLGQQVAEPVNGVRSAGEHLVTFDGAGLPSGVYFYRLRALPLDGAEGAKEFIATKTLVLVR